MGLRLQIQLFFSPLVLTFGPCKTNVQKLNYIIKGKKMNCVQTETDETNGISN